MAELWKGAPVAAALTERLCGQAERLRARGISPTRAIVRVGERAADLSYERGACKRCEMIGISVKHFILPVNCTQEELLTVIRRINEDGAIHGCLLFRPLPRHLDEAAVCAALSPVKDVDGITSGSLAAVFSGQGAGYPPCTAQAVLEILDHFGCELRGKRVTVVGRSLVVGKPAAMMLMGKNATVTVCHTKTVNTAEICRKADILVSAAGVLNSLTKDYVRPGQVVIDVSINWDENKPNARGGLGAIAGDAVYAEVEPIVEAITPVPGGVGSVTTSVLMKHVIEAAERV